MKIQFLLQKCLKISLLVNFTLLLMVKAVVHLAQGGEDRPSWAKSTFKLVSDWKKKD